jgi:hypothetical protein
MTDLLQLDNCNCSKLQVITTHEHKIYNQICHTYKTTSFDGNLW